MESFEQNSLPSLTKKLALLIGGVMGTVVLIAVVSVLLRAPDDIQGAHRLSVADFSLSGDVSQTWQTVRLPDAWDKRMPKYDGFGWYRFHVYLEEKPKELWGVYMPKLSMNAEVYINGKLAGSGGSMDEPVSRYWNLPLYIQVSPNLLGRGDNEIRIRLRGFANGRAGLSPIFVGADKYLYPEYRIQLSRSHELSVGAFAINMTVGVMLLVWLIISRDIAFLWFAMGSLISCFYILDSFWVNVPLPQLTWRWITHTAVAWSMSFYYLFMLRMLRQRLHWFEYVLIAYIVVGTLLLHFADNTHQLLFALVLHMGGLAMMLHLIYLAFSGWLRFGQYLHLWLGICILEVAGFGFVDWIPVAFHIEKKTPYIYYLGSVAFSLAALLVLFVRFLHGLTVEKNFSKHLRDSLEEQKALLDDQHQRITSLERDMAISDERKRIVRELHDGLGGHLVGALSLSEQQQSDDALRDSIYQALDELRMVMDSLDVEADVLTMLGMLRERIEPRLKPLGIQLQWLIRCRPKHLPESTEATLHMMRMVQEAINNSMRHAQPRQIFFRVHRAGFCIADDGHGFDVGGVNLGRGLNHLQWRAKDLNASLRIRSSKLGTMICIRLHGDTNA